jgi:hypothetical protein
MSLDISDIGGGSTPSAEAWKPQVGDVLKGKVTFVADRPFVKWDDMRAKTLATVKIIVGDRAIYPRTHISDSRTARSVDELDRSPDRLMRAIATAVHAAGTTRLEEGGTLAIKRLDDAPVEINGRAFHAHEFAAKYTPPAAGVAVDEFDVPAAGDDEFPSF